MEYTITMAEVCELAHKLTVLKCQDKNIEVEVQHDEDTVYTEKAKEIYNNYYEIVTNTLGI